LWGPLGIETTNDLPFAFDLLRWNGLWGPLGIETIPTSFTAGIVILVGMACGAR